MKKENQRKTRTEEVFAEAIQRGLEQGRDDYLLRKASQIRAVAKMGFSQEDLDPVETESILRLIFDLADVLVLHLEVNIEEWEG